MSATTTAKGKTGNNRTRGEPTGHPDLRFLPGASPTGGKGTLLINGNVQPTFVIREARKFGAVTSTGGIKYFIVEFTFGIHQASGAGARTESRLWEMLEESRR